MDACMAKNPKREDLIKEYSSYLHEIICDTLKDIWDKSH